MFQTYQLLLSEMKQRGADLRVSCFGETKHNLSKDGSDEVPQKTLLASCPLLGGLCPAQPGPPGRTQGFPGGGSGKVSEERQPSSKVFRFGTFNSAVLLEKF